MGKRRREAESDDTVPSKAEYNIVFVDTSLDTHLAMLVSDSDTVLDFKRKLTQEHAKCFPNNGKIRIHSLKVKCKGNFYHLPDFMLACSALHGVKGNWFLSADVSGSLECCVNQKATESDTRDLRGVMSSGANKILALTMSLPDGVTKENIVSGMTVGQKVEKYSDRTAEFWRNDALENSLGTRSPSKKKCKLKYNEAVLHSPTLEDHCTQFHVSGQETLQPVLAGCGIDLGAETPKLTLYCMEETAEDAVVRYDPSNMECSGVVEGASIAATATDASKQKKINRRRKKLPHDRVIKTTHSSSDYCKEAKSFFSNTASSPENVNLSELSGIPEDGRCDNNSRAPFPLKGTNMKEPDTCHLKLKVDNINHCLEIKVIGKTSSVNDARKIDDKDRDKETDQPDIDDKQNLSSQNHDQLLSRSGKIGTLDQHEAHGNTMESVPADDFLGANKEMGCGSRSKKKVNKPGGKNCYDADGELSENIMHLPPLTLPSLELNSLKLYETARTDSTLPTAVTDLNVGNNHQPDLNQCDFDVSTKQANSSTALMDANGALEGIKSSGNNGKKKRSQKAAAIFQNISDAELKTKKSGSTGPHIKTSKSRKMDEKRELSMNHDLEVMLPSYNNTSASADPVITPKIGLPSRLLYTNNLEESEISGNSRRKKKVKKFSDSNLGKSAVKQTGRKEMNRPDSVEEQREVSLNHDPVPIEFEKLGNSVWHETDGNIRESAQPNSFSCTEVEMGHSFKKKRMAKKSRGKILEENDGEHSGNGIHLTPIAVPNLDLNLLNDPETKRTYSILPIAEADLDVGTKEDRKLLVNTSYRENEAQKAIGNDGLRHDSEVILPSSSKASGTDPESVSNEARFTTKLLDGDMVEEPKASRGHRRKQSVKKSANTAMNNLDMEEPANNGTSGSSAGLLCSPIDLFPEETGKGENLSIHKVKDVQMKMLDDLAADSERKVGDATINESDSMKLTQTMEDVGICEQRMEKKDHNSAGDCLTVPSVSEKENQVNNLESNRAHDSIEIVRIKDKKAKKKTKGQLIMSDFLESIPIKDQEVGVEMYATVEKANNFLDFEQECLHVDSQVLSHKSEEKLGEIHFTAASTDNLHGEDKDEGVNFKHYFLPGQKQDKVASIDKVKEATKSNEEMKSVKKIKKRGLPSVITSTELHNSAKLSESKDGKDKSRVSCSSGRKDGDFVVSLKLSENGVIDSSPTEMRGMTTCKEHNENTVASLFTKDEHAFG